MLTSFVMLSILIFPRYSYAIIFLPPLILIPIAKTVAVFIGFASAPLAGAGALWAYVSKKPIIRAMLISFGILVLMAVFLGVLLKTLNPERPFF